MKCTDCAHCKREITGKRTRYCELTCKDISVYDKRDECVNKLRKEQE